MRFRSNSTVSPVEPLEPRRLLSAGDPDVTFSGDGQASINYGGAPFDARAVAVRADGKTIVAGTKGGRLAVVRLNVDGSIDTTFGGLGLFEHNAINRPTDVAVQDDGR